MYVHTKVRVVTCLVQRMIIWSVPGNLSITISACNFRTTPNWTLKRLQSRSRGLKGNKMQPVKKMRPRYSNQVSYGWSPKTHHKIWPKPAQNRPLCTKRAVLIEQFFPIFSLFFPRKTGKTRKAGNISKFGNLTEEKIFGRLRIPIFGKINLENMNIQKITQKKIWKIRQKVLR